MELEHITRKYYRRLFILPSLNVLVPSYALLLSVIGIINSIPPTSLTNVLLSIGQYLLIGASLLIVYSVLLISKLFNFKRLLGLSSVIIITSAPAEIVFYRLTNLKCVGLLGDSGLVFVILNAFLNPLASLILSVIPPLILFKVVNTLAGVKVGTDLMASAATVVSLSNIAGFIYLAFIERSGRGFGYSPMRTIRAFLKTWFTGNPEKLENELGRRTLEADLRVKVIVFRRSEGRDIALIFPTLHYGPFRNVGSARFIYHLQSYLEGRLDTFIFHTAGSHEHNLVSSEDSEEIAKNINNALNSLYELEVGFNMCRPYRVLSNGGWEAFVLNGPTFVAPFIVNREKGNDDLPFTLWDVLENNEKAPILTALADSHSSKGPKVEDVDTLKPLINEVYRRYECRDGEEFYVGYGESRASLSECRGLCNDLVKAITFRFKDGSRYAIIYIYGNNMDRRFRRKLDRLVRDLGLLDAEIVTPDDHSCAASIKESPYDVVSECKSLVKAIKEALSNAVSDESRAKYVTTELVIKNVKFVGEKIFDMAGSIEKIGKEAEVLFLVLVAVINALPLIMLLKP